MFWVVFVGLFAVIWARFDILGWSCDQIAVITCTVMEQLELMVNKSIWVTYRRMSHKSLDSQSSLLKRSSRLRDKISLQAKEENAVFEFIIWPSPVVNLIPSLKKVILETYLLGDILTISTWPAVNLKNLSLSSRCCQMQLSSSSGRRYRVSRAVQNVDDRFCQVKRLQMLLFWERQKQETWRSCIEYSRKVIVQLMSPSNGNIIRSINRLARLGETSPVMAMFTSAFG